jgi:hypothetical protein
MLIKLTFRWRRIKNNRHFVDILLLFACFHIKNTKKKRKGEDENRGRKRREKFDGLEVLGWEGSCLDLAGKLTV